MKNIKKNKAFLILLIVVFSMHLNAQEWLAPAETKDAPSGVSFSAENKMHGKDLFNTNCKSCHGDIGKGNALPLVPPPQDFVSEKFVKNTDGEFFYKLSEGRGAMPSFKTKLSEAERWSVISYIRSFHPDYKAPEFGAVVEQVSQFEGKDLKLLVKYDQVNLEVSAEVEGMVNGQAMPGKGVRVGFFVKRNFGLLPIAKAITADEQGVAKAKFPSDLPGDSLGNYTIVVKLVDNDLYGNVEYSEVISWGKPFIYDSPLNYREMWGTRANAPLWLIFSYLGVVGLVWSVIFWVIFQLLKIKKLGQ